MVERDRRLGIHMNHMKKAGAGAVVVAAAPARLEAIRMNHRTIKMSSLRLLYHDHRIGKN